ncbi:MAG: ABC transporter ATP-binding protein [Myxococcota bacterium]
MSGASAQGGGAAPGAAPPRAALWRIFGYARPHAALVAVSLGLSLAFGAALYARAYLVKPILDDVLLPQGAAVAAPQPSDWLRLLGGDSTARREQPAPAPPDPRRRADLERHVREGFARVVLAAAVVIFSLPLLQFGRVYASEHFLGRVYIDIQRHVCARLLALPLRFHHDHRRGDLLSRTLRDASSAHGALGLLFADFAPAVLTVGLGVALLFAISWQLALVALWLGPLLFTVVALFGTRIRRSARRRQEKYADVTQRLVEILSGIKVIKAFRAEPLEEAAFRRETRRLFRRTMSAVRQRVFARSLVEMLNNAVAIGLLILGSLLLLRGRWGLTLGDLAAFAAVLATTYKPVKDLAKASVGLLDAQPAAERLFELLDSPAEIEDAPDAVAIERVATGVRLRDVSFSYGREPVLRHVSFEVKAGQVVAIVGPTGSGKTTLTDLLLRFYDPVSGAIEIDGVDLRRIQRGSLRRQIAVVTQEPFLFDGTIRENIQYGRPEATEAETLAAAQAAHVDEFALRLPAGYDTQVGAGGARLSGGQRQRVAIARALLVDPAILIFDEATSALDSKSERYVQDAIEALLGGRTVFVIAHRLSTIRRADRIVVLENGVVTQLGTHAELVREGGLYRELLDLQAAPRPGSDLRLN